MNDRFDDYARRLAEQDPVDRRGLMRRMLAAAGIGAGAVVFGSRTASAKPKTPCPPGMSECGGICRDLANSNTDCGTCGTVCDPDAVCRNGTCVKIPCTCPPPPPPPPPTPTCADGIKNGAETGVDCGGPTCPKCANGQTCASGSDCFSGNCVAGVCSQCPQGQTACGGVCTNTSSSVNNCGACGSACPQGPNSVPICSNGQCSSVCSAGFADCDGLPGTGCETNLLISNSNCGACGIACPAGTACSNGICASTCVPRTCQQLGVDCGIIVDNCGNPIECGSCTAPASCGGGGTPGVCG